MANQSTRGFNSRETARGSNEQTREERNSKPYDTRRRAEYREYTKKHAEEAQISWLVEQARKAPDEWVQGKLAELDNKQSSREEKQAVLLNIERQLDGLNTSLRQELVSINRDTNNNNAQLEMTGDLLTDAQQKNRQKEQEFREKENLLNELKKSLDKLKESQRETDNYLLEEQKSKEELKSVLKEISEQGLEDQLDKARKTLKAISQAKSSEDKLNILQEYEGEIGIVNIKEIKEIKEIVRFIDEDKKDEVHDDFKLFRQETPNDFMSIKDNSIKIKNEILKEYEIAMDENIDGYFINQKSSPIKSMQDYRLIKQKTQKNLHDLDKEKEEKEAKGENTFMMEQALKLINIKNLNNQTAKDLKETKPGDSRRAELQKKLAGELKTIMTNLTNEWNLRQSMLNNCIEIQKFRTATIYKEKDSKIKKELSKLGDLLKKRKKI